MSELQYTIRPLDEHDLGEWLRLRTLLWDEADENDHRSEMVDIIEHSDSQFVVVAEAGEGKLVGFLEASIRTFAEDCESDHVGYLEGWFVEDDYRQLGIGRALVEFAEKWARAHGCTEMASDAEIGNEVTDFVFGECVQLPLGHHRSIGQTAFVDVRQRHNHLVVDRLNCQSAVRLLLQQSADHPTVIECHDCHLVVSSDNGAGVEHVLQ